MRVIVLLLVVLMMGVAGGNLCRTANSLLPCCLVVIKILPRVVLRLALSIFLGQMLVLLSGGACARLS